MQNRANKKELNKNLHKRAGVNYLFAMHRFMLI